MKVICTKRTFHLFDVSTRLVHNVTTQVKYDGIEARIYVIVCYDGLLHHVWSSMFQVDYIFSVMCVVHHRLGMLCSVHNSLYKLINFQWCQSWWRGFFPAHISCNKPRIANFIRISIKIWMVHRFAVGATKSNVYCSEN